MLECMDDCYYFHLNVMYVYVYATLDHKLLCTIGSTIGIKKNKSVSFTALLI